MGLATGYINKPVFVNLCFFKFGFQVGFALIFYTYYTFGVKNLLPKTHFVCDFCRHRAFSFLFKEGENEEINDSQTVESHCFPHHFVESKEKMGLAPAAIVLSRGESHDSSIALKSLDYNRQMRSQSSAIGNYKYSNNCILVFACVNYKKYSLVSFWLSWQEEKGNILSRKRMKTQTLQQIHIRPLLWPGIL